MVAKRGLDEYLDGLLTDVALSPVCLGLFDRPVSFTTAASPSSSFFGTLFSVSCRRRTLVTKTLRNGVGLLMKRRFSLGNGGMNPSACWAEDAPVRRLLARETQEIARGRVVVASAVNRRQAG